MYHVCTTVLECNNDFTTTLVITMFIIIIRTHDKTATNIRYTRYYNFGIQIVKSIHLLMCYEIYSWKLPYLPAVLHSTK